MVEHKDDVSPEDNSVLSPPALSLLAIPTAIHNRAPKCPILLISRTGRAIYLNIIAVDLLCRLPPSKIRSQLVHSKLLLGRKRRLGARMKMWIRSRIKLIGQNHLSRCFDLEISWVAVPRKFHLTSSWQRD